MTPYQHAIIKTAQTIFITLLLSAIVLAFLRPYLLPKKPAMVELMQCRYDVYPIKWRCITQIVTLDAFNKYNEEAARERTSSE